MNRNAAAPRGGRMVALSGARGGVGATTLASNLAWFIGTALHRHTVLLDGELHTGTVALNFNLRFNNGLAVALQSPERVDQLLLERSTQSAGDRLHVLAGQENLDSALDYQPGSAGPLIEALRTRYNFVVADTGSGTGPFARDLLYIAATADHRAGPEHRRDPQSGKTAHFARRPRAIPRMLLVLNKAGTPGGLSQSYMEQHHRAALRRRDPRSAAHRAESHAIRHPGGRLARAIPQRHRRPGRIAGRHRPGRSCLSLQKTRKQALARLG